MENIVNFISDTGIHAQIWQPIMAILTFVTILVALFVALFGERIRRWMDRPILSIDFSPCLERCMRTGFSRDDSIQYKDKTSNIFDVDRMYFRLRIKNRGGIAHNLKAKIDIFDINSKPADRFEPNSLLWIDNIDVIDLAPGEDNYINLVSQIISKNHKDEINKLRIEIADRVRSRGIGWDRPMKSWILRVTLYGENLNKNVIKSWQVVPSREHGTRIDLKIVASPQY